jgi:phosphoenolpyruvate---glycerone phosphotransferase subunit DhaL
MGDTSTAKTIAVLSAICDEIERSKDYLCELDAALGDGDHGVSMAKSFHAVKAKLPDLVNEDVGAILSNTGMTLISEVGGAMGPLFGTAFLRAGKVVAGKQTVSAADIAAMISAAEAGIVQRGKAQLGDKTMLDAVHPAAEAAQQAVAEGAGSAEVLAAAAEAAQAGAVATKTLVAKIGRASRLGERTLGHQDAGATSVAIILRVAADALACDALDHCER